MTSKTAEGVVRDERKIRLTRVGSCTDATFYGPLLSLAFVASYPPRYVEPRVRTCAHAFPGSRVTRVARPYAEGGPTVVACTGRVIFMNDSPAT